MEKKPIFQIRRLLFWSKCESRFAGEGMKNRFTDELP